jgi:CBS-domain-containing membrane protein
MKQKIKRGLRVSRYVIYKETLVDGREHLWSCIGTIVGLGIIGFIQSYVLGERENIFLIGSMGASAVLVFAAIQSPLAQPRNLIGGHVISAIIGVTVCKLVPDIVWLRAPLAVALAITAMQMTKTLHPPGGATSLIAVTGSARLQALGYWYVLWPVLSGALILLVVALIFNNMTDYRKYPTSRKYTRLFRKPMKLAPEESEF